MQCSLVLGSGIGLLGIATVVTDLLLYYNKRNKIFVKAKYQQVTSSSSASTQDDHTHDYQALQQDQTEAAS